jgi:hypothetical protein
MRFALAALSLSLLLFPAQKTAVEQATELDQKAEAAAKAGNQSARIAADQGLYHLLNGSPQVMEALARAYAAAGNAAQALAWLHQFAAVGQTDEGLLTGTDQRLAAISQQPEYRQILERLRANESPIELGKTACTLPDAGLVAEDIDYDATTRTFLLTSILEAKIVRVGRDGALHDFALSPDHWPMVAIKIDPIRRVVWATEVAFDGFAIAPQGAWGRSVVLRYDLATGKLLSRIEGLPHTSLGDMVLTREGDVILSDGDGGGLYRLSREAMTKIDGSDFISPQTPALSPVGDLVFVPDYVRGIAIFDLKSQQVTWLNRDDTDKVALNGVDGLYIHGHSLLLTQNGTSPERVIQMDMDASMQHVIATRVIERGSAGNEDPTHGVLVDNNFYYIANAGWAQLDEHGRVKSGAKLTPARIMQYRLQ